MINNIKEIVNDNKLYDYIVENSHNDDTNLRLLTSVLKNLRVSSEYVSSSEIENSKGDITKIEGLEGNLFTIMRHLAFGNDKVADELTIDLIHTGEQLYKRVLAYKNMFKSNFHNENIKTLYLTIIIVILFISRYILSTTIRMNDNISGFKFVGRRANGFSVINRGIIIETYLKAAKTILNTMNEKTIKSLVILDESVIIDQSSSIDDSNIIVEAAPALIMGGAILTAIYLLRKVTWFFFHIKQNVSDYLEDVAMFTKSSYVSLSTGIDARYNRSVAFKEKKWTERLKKWAKFLEVKEKTISKQVEDDIAEENKIMTAEIVERKIDKRVPAIKTGSDIPNIDTHSDAVGDVTDMTGVHVKKKIDDNLILI